MLLLGAVLTGGLLRAAAEDHASGRAFGDPVSLHGALPVGVRSLPGDPDPHLLATPVGAEERNGPSTDDVIGVEEDECMSRRKAPGATNLLTAVFVGREPIASFVSSVAGSPFLGRASESLGGIPRHVRFQVFRI